MAIHTLTYIQGIPVTCNFIEVVLFIISRRCSDGFDRHRGEWLKEGCNTSGVAEVMFCRF